MFIEKKWFRRLEQFTFFKKRIDTDDEKSLVEVKSGFGKQIINTIKQTA